LDLEIRQFTKDLDSEELVAQLAREVAEAERLGVTGTPTFFINGRVASGAQPYENFKALIEREAARVGS
jgi:protein-disulfide isomerase